MPYKAIHRRDSWPPTILRLNEDEEIDDSGSTSSAIDEDPFSFFLSPPDDLDDDFEDLSAGIESSREKKKPKVRAVSPSKLAGRRPLLERDDDDEEAIYDDEDEEEESFVDRFGVALPISLRDFGRAHDKAKAKAKDSRRKTKEKERTNEMIEEFLFPSHKPFSSSRGRPNARLAPSRGGRGRGMTRSLPTLRQHSWREPSPDVWPIEEEIEEEEEDMVEELTSMSTTGVEETAPIPIPKPKKRVHWAF
ncbi:hypothetical protein F5884DRAFT_680493 [Xylogone sp. PMI_703]|nr:hypothetical protein F5884DRAFT_680493 [Xylogone sp. PMI_703]